MEHQLRGEVVFETHKREREFPFGELHQRSFKGEFSGRKFRKQTESEGSSVFRNQKEESLRELPSGSSNGRRIKGRARGSDSVFGK